MDASADAGADGTITEPTDGPTEAGGEVEVDAGPPPPACGFSESQNDCASGDGGAERFFVVDHARVAVPDPEGDPEVVGGFDLDGRASESDDPDTCFHGDFRSPPPESVEGIDNQFGPTLVMLDLDDNFAEQFDHALSDGRFLLLLAIDDLNDPLNDDCVQVALYYGVLPEGVDMPTFDEDGRFVAGQTFDVDASSFDGDGMTPLYRFEGRIVEGHFAATAPMIELRIPAPPDGEVLRLLHYGAQLSFTLAEDRLIDVVFGGAVSVEETTEEARRVLSQSIADALEVVLEQQADLQLHADRCRCGSTAYTFEAVQAVRGQVVSR